MSGDVVEADSGAEGFIATRLGSARAGSRRSRLSDVVLDGLGE